MKEPLEASLISYVGYWMSDSSWINPGNIHSRNPAQQTLRSSREAFPNADTLHLFSQLLDVTFDEKFAEFKHKRDEKEGATHL